MIVKTYIQENLRRLDVIHQSTTNIKDGFYLSKLAILELCGWIEVSMDDVVMRHCGRKISEAKNIKYVEKSVVHKTHGFDYEIHFRKMMIQLVGIVSTEQIEAGINGTTHALFDSELRTLKTIRDALAHTYSRNFPPIDSPARTRLRFAPIYNGLKAYDGALRAR